MKATIAKLIPKVEYDYIKEDKKIIELITNRLTNEISEKLIQVIEANDEIIIKKPVLRVSEYPPTYAIEYRKSVEWELLTRCKDCKHSTEEALPDLRYCTMFYRTVNADFFCACGERRVKEKEGEKNND